MRLFLSLIFALCLWNCQLLAYGAIRVVAAENVYGAIAQELGQQQVQVSSILNNPNQDPHLFSAKASTGKAVVDADVLIYNGADYDSWFQRFLSDPSKNSQVSIINVGQLVGAPPGANPHLWYRLSTIQQVAVALTRAYQRREPGNTELFEARLQAFLGKQQRLNAQVAALKQQLHGMPVTATEPVAAYLAEDLGLTMLDSAFQLAIMNDAEPSALSRSQFEAHLKNHQVRALIYNLQVQDPVTQAMQSLALQQGIPIIGVTELLPKDQNFDQWYQDTLNRFQDALLKGSVKR